MSTGGTQEAFRLAVRESGIQKPATVHTLRHSFASHLLDGGAGIRIVKAFSAEDAQEGKLRDILRERIRVLLGLVKLQVIMFSLDTFASRLGQMVVIAYGGFLVIRGDLTIGTIVGVVVLLGGVRILRLP